MHPSAACYDRTESGELYSDGISVEFPGTGSTASHSNMGFYDQCEQGLYFISTMDGDFPGVYDLSDGSLFYHSR